MKAQLSLTALAILSVMAPAQGASFALSEANTQQLDKSGWACKRCDAPQASSTIGLSAGAVSSNDDHAANRFGAKDGATAGINADATLNGDADGRLDLNADQLGMSSGYGSARYRDNHIDARFDYAKLRTVDATAQTQYGFDGRNLVALEQPIDVDLEQRRERTGLGLAYQNRFAELNWRTYARYDHEAKTGFQSSSTQFIKSPVNITAPVDTTTQTFNAGAELGGQNWLTALSYQGSLFENAYDGLYNGERGAVQALAPNNEAHLVALSGQYRMGKTRLTGRLTQGWLYQNDTQFVDPLAAPNGITHANGEVRTQGANLRLTSALGGVRLAAKYDYSDRDNRTPVFAYEQDVSIDALSGTARMNTPLDTTRHRYGLDASTRLSQRVALEAGYQGERTERNHSVRETTEDNTLWARTRVTALDNLDLSLKASYGQRDGSRYQASESTSSEDNTLLRKYYLADRDRTELTFDVSYNPLADLTLDATVRYAKDDYSESEIGLLDSDDLGYDLAASYRISKALNLHAFAGQQWIESNQAGSQSFAAPDWTYRIEDRFDYAGIGARYSGLMQDRLTVGADYQYTESSSDTQVSEGQPYGDYFQWAHSVRAYADYILSERTNVRLDYRYERYYDTDYADVASDSIPGLITLGDMGHNYNAHLLMLTLTYSL
ncbi:MtrB/PioB family decaheme-associated outer membrane protein [Ferrimonas balearica]|uniref:MtrB/PioB family decaheme-associated outer membrane protein n=1 Tax=Ferrimonas balearica TaxID=44012 RepID=UPI001C9A2244|nr:MtrB/PioB family decaheme-associated outer membrane protein [Ferrimonas balearica]MBY5922649.1 MtrB/PioB family decaheme-associated outer membrane protein [Ferrimonas balearica]MBY5995633.1 MtrB/PioB family decaheme-associated outer membrane protein [Ferrimonas balearica]